MKQSNRKILLEELDDCVEEYNIQSVEEMLEESVKVLWLETRKGPHDDCDCYDYYRHELKKAIRALRAWRNDRSFCV